MQNTLANKILMSVDVAAHRMMLVHSVTAPAWSVAAVSEAVGISTW